MRKDEKSHGDRNRQRYCDNSLIFKVIKERRGGGWGWGGWRSDTAAIWAALIVFYADRSGRTIGDS